MAWARYCGQPLLLYGSGFAGTLADSHRCCRVTTACMSVHHLVDLSSTTHNDLLQALHHHSTPVLKQPA
jgi:hypothetical protein